MKKVRSRLIIVHPGTQHAWQLANAVAMSGLFGRVELYTGLIIRKNSFLARVGLLSCRHRSLDQGIRLHNFYAMSFLHLVTKKIGQMAGYRGNVIDYFWQILFGLILLPVVYMRRKDCILVLFETCAWPLGVIAKHQNIPVIIDFPGVSQEQLAACGIKETFLAQLLKTVERKSANYAFFCSELARSTYEGKLAVSQSFVHYPGANWIATGAIADLRPDLTLTMAVIANNVLRKGLDLILKAFNEIKGEKTLFIIGSIERSWIVNFCMNNDICLNGVVITGKLESSAIVSLLIREQVVLHLLPSRSDSFATVVPETMGMGILNILSHRVGAGELLRDGEDVLIMKALTWQSLLSEIDYYSHLPIHEKRQLQKNVIAKAAQMTWHRYMTSVTAAFKQLLRQTSDPYENSICG